MGITYSDHLTDSGYRELTPEQEREIDDRKATDWSEIMDAPFDGTPDLRGKEIANLRSALERCRTVLGNMALENEGHARIFCRWPISHEPLRNDAKNLLPIIDEALHLERNT